MINAQEAWNKSRESFESKSRPLEELVALVEPSIIKACKEAKTSCTVSIAFQSRHELETLLRELGSNGYRVSLANGNLTIRWGEDPAGVRLGPGIRFVSL